jgi:hypothetical protein
MIRPILMTAGLIVCLWSCGNKTETASTVPGSPEVADTAANVPSPYFPLYDYMLNEIEYVDSLPVGIMKYSTVGKEKDSGYIQLEEFHQLAEQFLTPEIRDSSFAKTFKETSFFDRSSNNATFFYKTEDTASQIKRVDIVTGKGEIYDEVKSIYIEKNIPQAEGLVVKKLYWKPKRNFQIITVNEPGGSKLQNELIKVVWDNRE